uniref:MATH domain-containing protein n=1 Tax=Brassica oleracea var. oleracea TaxID=109376 RepID=A0A0D3AXH7_BRAOL
MTNDNNTPIDTTDVIQTPLNAAATDATGVTTAAATTSTILPAGNASDETTRRSLFGAGLYQTGSVSATASAPVAVQTPPAVPSLFTQGLMTDKFDGKGFKMWQKMIPVYRLLQGEPYESSVFEAAGYKWRLVLHVGNAGYISLYLRIEEAESIPYGLEVNVDLKLFVHVPKLDKYLTVTDGAVRFNAEKKELGFEQLIDLASFENTNEGYIVQDTCSFGVEIFIVKPAKVQEKVTFVSNPPRNVFTWMIPHFSDMEDKFYYSDDFLVGDRYWKLGLNPKGGSALPIYLYAQGFRPDAVATNTWGAVNLRLKNQRSTNHREIYSAAWYPIRSDYGVGVNSIISLADLHYASKGYLVNDAIIFEAEMVKVTVTNIVSV